MSTKDRRKELQQQYSEIKTEAGIYRIVNTVNKKSYVDGSPNLRNLNGYRFALNSGAHMNKELQSDWTKYGEDAFEFEVLEILEKKDNPFFRIKDELKKLEEKWLEKLRPYGEQGYNSPPK
ncbi:GIY-YIG nuclease family protein [Paenibacillus puerhi]|uniref:GIY-YIG nuclease family protein n=1 Tax=Paenibacillus puerhi TaxID=2692622 RepID=UPI00135C80B5|nr:GIY-YIG nuclease family protein [Paenibacillus puerhi]